MTARYVTQGAWTMGIALAMGFTLGAPKASQLPQKATNAAPARSVTQGERAGSQSSSAEAPAITTPMGPRDARREAWKRLREGIGNKDTDHRVQAIYALGTIGVRSDTVRPIEMALHEDKDSFVRQAAARTLGDMKSRRSIPALHSALDDKSAAVSFAAAQALWHMGDQSGTSILVQVLAGDRGVSPGVIHTEWHDMHEELHDPVSLAEFGAEQAAGAFLGPAGFGVTAVEELAKDKTAGARALSATLLGSGTDPGDRIMLEQALNDRSWVVKAAAAEALGRMGDSSEIAKLIPLLDNGRPAVKYKAAAAIVRLTARKAG